MKANGTSNGKMTRMSRVMQVLVMLMLLGSLPAKQAAQAAAGESPAAAGKNAANLGQAPAAVNAPPTNMFSWPWSYGQAWLAVGGFSNGMDGRDISSAHRWENGGALDLAPHGDMHIGEDTSQFYVYAAASGTVAAHSACWVKINHAGGWVTEYYHLDRVDSQLYDGGPVDRSRPLGVIANNAAQATCSGGSWQGPHVHFSLRSQMEGATFSGWTINYDHVNDHTRFTKNGTTVGIYSALDNQNPVPPIPFQGNASINEYFDGTGNKLIADVCADNLPGHTVYLTAWRDTKWWSDTRTASSRCVNFPDIDGAGDVLFDRPYRIWVALDGAPDTNWPVHCFGATGGYGMCTLAQYPNTDRDGDLNCYALNVSVNPQAGGRVDISPAPNCGSKYLKDTMVSLHAVPNAGYAFTTWSGGTEVSAAAIDVGMDGDKAVTANFAGIPAYNTAWFTDAQLEGESSTPVENIRYFLKQQGSCLANPIQDVDGASIDVPALIHSAAVQYTLNPKLFLATMQKEQSAITRCPGTTQLRLLMGYGSASTARQQIDSAGYQFRRYQTDLGATGSTISGWQVGVAKTTQDGVAVTPASKAIAGQFSYTPYAGVNWGGNNSSVGGVWLFWNAWYNLFNFTQALPHPACYSLTTGATPAASGTISASPAPECNNGTQYADGTVVQLSAHAAANSTFASWSGDAAGTSSPVSVTMNANKAVTATFNPIVTCYNLSSSAAPSASGTISTNPLPNCNGGTQYTSGTSVQLSANPAAGFTFGSWSGDASGTMNPVSVTMNANKAVTANFNPATPPSGVSLSLSPAAVSSWVGNEFNVDVKVNAGTQSMDGAQINLDFDKSKLSVVSLTAGTLFPVELLRQFDNNAGTIDYAAGALSNFPSGSFTVLTIKFHALALTSGTNLSFQTAASRKSDVTLAGKSVLGATSSGSVSILAGVVEAKVSLQGRPAAPDARWMAPLHVTLTASGQSSPAYTFDVTSDSNGHFNLSGVGAGSYDIRVKGAHTLQNTVSGVTIAAGSNPVLDLGTLREGDANNDNTVSLLDFSILASTFNKCAADAGYDARADFNQDGCVSLMDFSLLASNFNKAGGSAASTSLKPAGTPASASLVLDPQSSVVWKGNEFTVNVWVAAGANSVDGAQASLKFDPKKFAVVGITSGSTFTQVLVNTYDNANGRIVFAAGSLANFPSGTFKLMTVRLKAIDAAAATTLEVLRGAPQPSDITFAGNSVLGTTAGSQITIKDAFKFFIPLARK